MVRHRFYSWVDWTKCSAMEKEVLEPELVAVIEACIDEFAPEFPESKRTELAKDVIAEIRQHGCTSMLEYAKRLNPPIPLHEKIGQIIKNKLCEWLERRNPYPTNLRGAR